ncbi:MAG TPA: hypothetical protein VG225_17480 [Terracidiphilus sp.]|jgi:hypothetical protein|nr:hypothetical protein [Terracidiphilus sp.]
MPQARLQKLGVLILMGYAAVSTQAAAQASPSSRPVTDKQAVLRAATASYYNLRNEGLVSFQCDMAPNWEAELEDERKQDPEGTDAVLKTLNQLRFTVNLAADDTVKLTHNEITGQTQRMMDALSQIYGGMEQLTSGFFDTWKLFMVTSPFPAVNSEYALNDLGPRYRLTYEEKGSGSDVATMMGHDFAITTMQVTTADFDSSIQPTFGNTAKGYLFMSYVADYRSQKAEETTHLDVKMDYQQVDGLQMPQHLHLAGTYGGSPFKAEMTFSGCQVTKKQPSGH